MHSRMLLAFASLLLTLTTTVRAELELVTSVEGIT